MAEIETVLVVDDEPAIRASIVQWLGLAGFQVVPCKHASEALAKLELDFPGIVVTDIKMEDINGLELLRRIRELDPDLPVIVLTGYGTEETRSEAMRLSAWAFMDKPFDPELLLTLVRSAISFRKQTLDGTLLPLHLRA